MPLDNGGSQSCYYTINIVSVGSSKAKNIMQNFAILIFSLYKFLGVKKYCYSFDYFQTLEF